MGPLDPLPGGGKFFEDFCDNFGWFLGGSCVGGFQRNGWVVLVPGKGDPCGGVSGP